MDSPAGPRHLAAGPRLQLSRSQADAALEAARQALADAASIRAEARDELRRAAAIREATERACAQAILDAQVRGREVLRRCRDAALREGVELRRRALAEVSAALARTAGRAAPQADGTAHPGRQRGRGSDGPPTDARPCHRRGPG